MTVLCLYHGLRMSQWFAGIHSYDSQLAMRLYIHESWPTSTMLSRPYRAFNISRLSLIRNLSLLKAAKTSVKMEKGEPKEIKVVVTGGAVCCPHMSSSKPTIPLLPAHTIANILSSALGRRYSMAADSYQFVLAHRQCHAARHFQQRKAHHSSHRISGRDGEIAAENHRSRPEIMEWRESTLPTVHRRRQAKDLHRWRYAWDGNVRPAWRGISLGKELLQGRIWSPWCGWQIPRPKW